MLFAKIAVHAPEDYAVGRKDYMYAFLELLGMDRDRVIFIKEPVGTGTGASLRFAISDTCLYMPT